jgi:hypothetical protein
LNKGGNGGQVPDGYCGSEENIQLQASAPCKGPDCSMTPVYINSPWGPCSAPCGGGIQARTIMCGTYLIPDFSLPKLNGVPPASSAASFGSVYDLVYGDPDNPYGQQFVETQWCDGFLLRKDATVQQCNLSPCAAPEVSVTYADVRTLHPLSPSNATATSLIVPAGSRRYFELPLALGRDRAADLGICIHVEMYATAATPKGRKALPSGAKAGWAPPTCSERAVAALGGCTATLDECLSSTTLTARTPASPPYFKSYLNLLPGRAPDASFAAGMPSFSGFGEAPAVCACYAAAQACLAQRACTPASWQVPSLGNQSLTLQTACLASVCGWRGGSALASASCAPLTPGPTAVGYGGMDASYARENTSSIHIYASWLLAGAPMPNLYAPNGVLPSTRANSDLAAVPLGYYTPTTVQGLAIPASEIPVNAYGLMFSVASPSGGFAGTVEARVFKPAINGTFLSNLQGTLPPIWAFPTPVTLDGNFSQGALYNYTQVFLIPSELGGGGLHAQHHHAHPLLLLE